MTSATNSYLNIRLMEVQDLEVIVSTSPRIERQWKDRWACNFKKHLFLN